MRKLISTSVLATAMVTLLSGCYSVKHTDSHSHHNVEIHSQKIVSENLSQQKFSNLKIDVSDADIIFKNGSNYQVKYTGNKKTKPTVQQNGDSLTIKDKSSFSIDSDADATLTITIPEKLLDKVDISTNDGDISGENIHAQTINLSSDDGDVKFDDLTAKDGKINLSDGDIHLKNLKTTSGFNINTDDGDVMIHKTNASGLSLTADDGIISVASDRTNTATYKKNIHSKNVLHISTSDGDITVR
ncbi:DUF4097 and DUF4098 domain-containing protein YvlB [Lactobacillus colini]|uniref:DUF4097 and DUF4098 domain-containing protein YvlB n=1 Tax=Lactobacillus colini TaxID=1819254 RepID=A0ABS4MCP2_9LACO|nr:DUF4097 family beta strand repeat-containing protein [Lactobacillus colini]MBP2057456.1 DUF4097 and DUF4098 domain-containing protein YvlB [Lactobacillus colini]